MPVGCGKKQMKSRFFEKSFQQYCHQNWWQKPQTTLESRALIIRQLSWCGSEGDAQLVVGDER
jgi:hypothetical protein